MSKQPEWLIVFCLGLSLVMIAACAVNPAERNNAGNDLYNRGDYAEAVEAYQAAQVNDPDRPEAYYNDASALSQSGRMQSAIAALEQALKTADDGLAAQAYYNLGNVYFEMALYADAVTAYREALLLRPDDAEARFNYELALQRLPTATPPPQELETDPEEDESEPEVTPTPNPSGQDQPSPTPSPSEGEPEETAEPEEGDGDVTTATVTPSTPTPNPNGSLTIEDAERILDAVQQDQQTLREYLEEAVSPVPPSAKDW
ncbi:MAG: tetratricopeptide repeat protein [Anaerolineae bacterium]|nr:tetratricopeptide repeat protein [Anaerolineae bacterium]